MRTLHRVLSADLQLPRLEVWLRACRLAVEEVLLMTFDDVREALAARGMTRENDARTAFAAWQRNPACADGLRVQAILEAEGVL